MKNLISTRKFYSRCRSLWGFDLPKFGIPFDGALGAIEPQYIDEMLAAVEMHPELHIASFRNNGFGYNKYIPEMDYYFLCNGDSDPKIKISPKVKDKFEPMSDEKFKQIQDFFDRNNANRESDPMWYAINNWVRKRPI